MKNLTPKKSTLAILAGVLMLGLLCGSAFAVSLKDTVEQTIKYHPTIKAFQEYRQAAQHDLSRARSGWYPRVDARAAYGINQWKDRTTRLETWGQGTEDWYRRSEASLVISQTIWDGFATWHRVEIGESRLDSARERLFDNAENLALDALLAHIEVFRQSKLLALAEVNVQNHFDILNSQKERQRLGASTMADVTQTESRLARTQASLAETRSALEVAQSNYKRLTDWDPVNLEAPEMPEGAFPSLEVAQAHAVTGNLKVLAQRADIETAKSQAGLDKSPFHPQIYLEAGPSYTKNVQSSHDESWGTGIMLRANWNLFNGGYDWYNMKADQARVRQSRHELNSLLDNLYDETTSTWSYLVSAQEQAKYYGNAVEFSTSTRDMYLEQFNVGQRSLLDVLDSENELYSSSIQYVTAQLNVVATQYRLLALAGELLKNFDVDRGTLVIKTTEGHVPRHKW